MSLEHKDFDLTTDESNITGSRKDIENYLNDSINELSKQLDKNESLYDKVDKLFEEFNNTATMGSTKNLIELANALSKIRSTGVDVADRVFKARLAVLNTEQQYKKIKSEETTNNQTEAVMAALTDILNSNQELAKKHLDTPVVNNISDAELDALIDKKVKSGELKLTQNDIKGIKKYEGNNIKGE